MLWDEQDKAMLRDRWNNGVSAGIIEQLLNGRHTRNAIIGKVYRMKLDHSPKRKVATRLTQPSRPEKRKPKKEEIVRSKYSDIPDIERIRKLRTDRVVNDNRKIIKYDRPVGLMELQEMHCRWLLGPNKYCGKKKMNVNVAYCEEHHSMATVERRSA